MSKLNKVTIYTDGACSGNPGAGGWGAVLIFQDETKEISGSSDYTTNNQMELMAAIRSLESLDEKYEVEIYTDSRYLELGMTVWIKSWLKNNWRNSQRQEVKNKDLWLQLLNAVEGHNIVWRWVKAHNGDPANERADQLARAGYEKRGV